MAHLHAGTAQRLPRGLARIVRRHSSLSTRHKAASGLLTARPVRRVPPPLLSRTLCRRHLASGRRSAWACTECGYGAAKWTGRCPACGASGGDVFEQVDTSSQRGRGGRRTATGLAAAQTRAGSGDPVPLSELSLVSTTDAHGAERRMRASITTPGLSEFDVVVGGGLVPGSLVLLGGEPGVGKTTLLLQVAAALAGSSGSDDDDDSPQVLYASGEETVSQIAHKAQRLLAVHSGTTGADDASTAMPLQLPENLHVVCETSVERLEELLSGGDYAVAMIDSVQTCVTEDSTSGAGSIATLRAVADRLMNLAKRSEVALVMAGHVTKDGQIAGPRLLEHLVDVVLYFDGSDGATTNTGYRLLRCHKNRFGPTGAFSSFESIQPTHYVLHVHTHCFVHNDVQMHGFRQTGGSIY